MADPSRPPTYKNYNVIPVCSGCGRKLTYHEPLWFVGRDGSSNAVFCFQPECAKEAARG